MSNIHLLDMPPKSPHESRIQKSYRQSRLTQFATQISVPDRQMSELKLTHFPPELIWTILKYVPENDLEYLVQIDELEEITRDFIQHSNTLHDYRMRHDVEYLKENEEDYFDYKWKKNSFVRSIFKRGGSVEMLNYFKEYVSKKCWTYYSDAVHLDTHNNIQILEWLHDHGCKFSEVYTFSNAIKSPAKNTLQILEWLASKECPFKWFQIRSSLRYIKANKIEIIQFLIDRDMCEDDILGSVSNLEVVQYLYGQGYRCQGSYKYWLCGKTDEEKMERVEWLLEHDFPKSDRVWRNAVRISSGVNYSPRYRIANKVYQVKNYYRDWKMFKLLLEKDFPKYGLFLSDIVHYPKEIVKWALDNEFSTGKLTSEYIFGGTPISDLNPRAFLNVPNLVYQALVVAPYENIELLHEYGVSFDYPDVPVILAQAVETTYSNFGWEKNPWLTPVNERTLLLLNKILEWGITKTEEAVLKICQDRKNLQLLEWLYMNDFPFPEDIFDKTCCKTWYDSRGWPMSYHFCKEYTDWLHNKGFVLQKESSINQMRRYGSNKFTNEEIEAYRVKNDQITS